MSDKPRIGLLPLYVRLYDQIAPDLRPVMASFAEKLQAELARKGVEVVAAPICCVKKDFAAAVAMFERRQVDMVAAVHLAYSPSLEAVDALVRTRLPLLLLDVTRDYDFGQSADPALLLYNHGIHGLQDLACMLRRRGRQYEIVAGHYLESDALSRAADIARAAKAARRFSATRALRVGGPFKGMGDFALPAEAFRRLGITVKQIDLKTLGLAIRRVTDREIEAEMAQDRQRFEGQVKPDVHRRSARVGLGLRRCVEDGGFTACSVNFLCFVSRTGPVDTIPFLEIAKGMSRGVGYGGEGDLLTAAMVGGLIAGWERTTFTEMFCPDWKGDSIFLSHMGEINPAVAAGKATMLEKDYTLSDTHNPVMIACAPAPGPATYANLAPGPKGRLTLIVAPVEVLEDSSHPNAQTMVRGWIRARKPVGPFLEEYSRWGGTHHSALVLGQHTEALAAFGRFLGAECHVIA